MFIKTSIKCVTFEVSKITCIWICQDKKISISFNKKSFEFRKRIKIILHKIILVGAVR